MGHLCVNYASMQTQHSRLKESGYKKIASLNLLFRSKGSYPTGCFQSCNKGTRIAVVVKSTLIAYLSSCCDMHFRHKWSFGCNPKRRGTFASPSMIDFTVVRCMESSSYQWMPMNHRLIISKNFVRFMYCP